MGAKEFAAQVKRALAGNGVDSHVLNAYQRTFESEEGRIVLEDLCKRYYIFDTLAKPGAERDELLLNEGKRNVVLFILGLLNVNYAMYEHVLHNSAEE